MRPKLRILGAFVVVGCAHTQPNTLVGATEEDQVRACYKPALDANPGLAGDVTLEVQVTSAGEVVGVNLKRSDIKDAAVESCIAQSVVRWDLAPPPDGTAKYELTFALDPSGGRAIPSAVIGKPLELPEITPVAPLAAQKPRPTGPGRP